MASTLLHSTTPAVPVFAGCLAAGCGWQDDNAHTLEITAAAHARRSGHTVQIRRTQVTVLSKPKEETHG